MIPFVASAGAAELEPVLAPADAPEQFKDWMKEQGTNPVDLRCLPTPWTEVLSCVRVRESSGRRWVTVADPTEWNIPAPVPAAVVPMLNDGIAYWTVEKAGTSWALFHPQELEKTLGPNFLAAVPADGVFVAWKPGNTETDRVMSVGVQQMYDSLENPVSEWVHRWDGSKWTVWGRAVPK